MTVPFTRSQRRHYSKLLRQSLAPPRFNAGIRANKLHRSYPLRLRQQGLVTPSAPTIAQRSDFRKFKTLRSALCVLSVAPSCSATPIAPLLCRLTQVRRERGRTTRTCVCNLPGFLKPPHPSQCKAKYCPVPAAHSPNSFSITALTTRQRVAANKILSHVHLSCHSAPLRMALQAPACMRESLGPKANTSPIIWDSGASISITPDLSNFHGPVSPQGKITQLKVIAKSLQMKGHGEVNRAVHNQLGNLQILKVPAYHVPNIKVQFLSTTSLLQTDPDKLITIEPNRLTLSGIANDNDRGPITANVNTQNNLPTSEVYNATDPVKATDALASIVNTVHEQKLNLTEAEKELLRWHYRLGHIGFK
jgi:hypothetical protein